MTSGVPAGLLDGFFVANHLRPISGAMPSIAFLLMDPEENGLSPNPVVLSLPRPQGKAVKQLHKRHTCFFGTDRPNETRFAVAGTRTIWLEVSDARLLDDLVQDFLLIVTELQGEAAGVVGTPLPFVDTEASLTVDESRDPVTEIVFQDQPPISLGGSIG